MLDMQLKKPQLSNVSKGPHYPYQGQNNYEYGNQPRNPKNSIQKRIPTVKLSEKFGTNTKINY